MVWGTKSRYERGYGAAWVKLRIRIMERDHGLCQVCRKAGRVTVAYAVDHIASKANAARLKWARAQMDDPSNLKFAAAAITRTQTRAAAVAASRAPDCGGVMCEAWKRW